MRVFHASMPALTGPPPAMTKPHPRRRGPARAPPPRWALVAISGLLLASPLAPARGDTVPALGPAEGPAFGPLPLPPAPEPAADPARLAGPRLARLDAAPALGPLPARPGPAIPAGPRTASGLPWRSGASCGHPAFEAWRGRKLDVQVQFVWHDSWDQMAARLNSSYFRTALTWTPQPIVSLAMLPTSARQQHAACAAGKFDGYFRQFGQILTASGAGNAIVRIGWEPNTGTHNHPCHPSVQPRGPKRRRRDEPLQAGLKAADAAPEEGGQAAAEIAGLSIRGFFSSGVASWTTSHIP